MEFCFLLNSLVEKKYGMIKGRKETAEREEILSLPKKNPHLRGWQSSLLLLVGVADVSVARFSWYCVDVVVSFTFIPLWHHNIWPQKIGMPRPNELLVMKANVGTRFGGDGNSSYGMPKAARGNSSI